MGDTRILAHTEGGGTLLLAVEGDQLPAGDFDPELYAPVRIYDVARDSLSEPLWLGSAMKFLGGYLEEPALEIADEERVLARVADLLEIASTG